MSTPVGGSVLDLGCGYETSSTERYVKRGTVGVDLKAGYADLLCDVTKGLPFSDESFDCVIIYGSLDHFSEPLEVLREAYRVCRHWIQIAQGNASFWAQTLNEPSSEHLYQWNLWTLTQLLQLTGFNVTEYGVDNWCASWVRYSVPWLFERVAPRILGCPHVDLWTHDTIIVRGKKS